MYSKFSITSVLLSKDLMLLVVSVNARSFFTPAMHPRFTVSKATPDVLQRPDRPLWATTFQRYICQLPLKKGACWFSHHKCRVRTGIIRTTIGRITRLTANGYHSFAVFLLRYYLDTWHAVLTRHHLYLNTPLTRDTPLWQDTICMRQAAQDNQANSDY